MVQLKPVCFTMMLGIGWSEQDNYKLVHQPSKQQFLEL
jgi:hypothetical protein